MRGGLFTSGRSVRLWSAWRRFVNAPRQNGFTVIEVLIVLGVSAALFVAAAIMIAGRQNQTAFDQSIRQVQSQIQQAVNEVSTGYYPNNANFQCTAGAGGPVLASGTAEQGTNSGCIFLGKAMQFKVGNADPDQFTVYTLTGLQKSGGGSEASSLAEAMPTVVAPSTLHSSSGYPDNSVDEELQNGLRVARMWYNNGGGDVEIGALAFVNSLASYGSTGEIVSGSGSVNVVAIDDTSLGMSKTAAVDAMNSDADNRIATGTINPSGGVFICLDGGTDDYAIVQIGGDLRELSVTLVTKDKGGNACTYP